MKPHGENGVNDPVYRGKQPYLSAIHLRARFPNPFMLGKYLKLEQSGHFLNMPHHSMRRENPMDYLIFWVLEGHGFAASGGERLEAGPGHLITLVPHKAHEYRSDKREPWEIVWVHFTGQLASCFVKKIRGLGGMRADLGLNNEIRDRWFDLVIAHSARGQGFEAKTDTALYALLGLIIHRLQLNTRAPQAKKTLNVHRLQNYIHHHLAEPITLDQLARQASLSSPHFSRVFRKLFSVSPMHYVLQKRIAQACSLLTETSMQLKQISRAIGYDDPYYFSRLFKKMMGANPSAWRRTRQPSRFQPADSRSANIKGPSKALQ